MVKNSLLDIVERWHNRASDSNFVWFPFLKLKLIPQEVMTQGHGGLLFLILLTLSFEKARADATIYWGVAKDAAGKTVYTERHSTEGEGALKSSQTDYFDALRKNIIGTMRSDYTRSIAMPTYEFEDLRTGYREGLRYSDSKYIVYYKKPAETEKTKELKEGESIFSCQGWHYYLIGNLNVLEKQDLALNLVLPSELDFYSFKIRQSDTNGDQIVANLELSNWFLSVFAPKLRLVYDKQLKKLIEYKGISNILDDSGARQDVTIHYEYGDLKGKVN